MKEKTAMQQLIDWHNGNGLEVILNADTVLYKAMELLETERRQIEQAYLDGIHPLVNINFAKKVAKEYYDNKFKQ